MQRYCHQKESAVEWVWLPVPKKFFGYVGNYASPLFNAPDVDTKSGPPRPLFNATAVDNKPGPSSPLFNAPDVDNSGPPHPLFNATGVDNKPWGPLSPFHRPWC